MAACARASRSPGSGTETNVRLSSHGNVLVPVTTSYTGIAHGADAVADVLAAVENLLLTAHSEGLGAIWRTGPAARDRDVKKFLGFEPDQQLLGFVYIGFPDPEVPVVERPSYEDRTVWMN